MAGQSEPVRLTKHRAQVLLDMAENGIEAERYEIKQTFGVHFNSDGTLSLTEDEFNLLDPDRREELAYRLTRLTAAVAAISIFQRRYVL